MSGRASGIRKAAFRNSFWLRNPNFKAKNIFDYDEEGREIGVRPGERKRIALCSRGVSEGCRSQRPFSNPEQAWEAGFALNDGGISYLAEHLRPLCNPELKRQQLAGQVTRLREQMVERISHYYVSDNPELEIEKRRTAAQQVAGNLIDCAGEQRFGELLRALQPMATSWKASITGLKPACRTKNKPSVHPLSARRWIPRR
jgi:hypothetical protein